MAKDVHPAVRQTLDITRDVIDLLQSAREEALASQAGVLNDDGDIAVNVDHRGALVNVWFKPGVLDRKRPARVAAEINALLATAGDASIAKSQQLITDAMKIVPTLVADLPEESEYFPFGTRNDGGRG
ncbi:hypothetical protein [Tsukamurella pseudospumae]|uniref:YbaB/EbfC DNA-binding family protein n=1 Tax=Tsukamurella pseudospumae TaxID=239498 RepID=A0A137Z807_9ACTN|nr:hypothetical protein [Tsukamurella pseudospumae]KXO94314.1 hypothetical protein AXK61_23855 [Tsukamurella pseudospumae]